jgi:hypothetical protein
VMLVSFPISCDLRELTRKLTEVLTVIDLVYKITWYGDSYFVFLVSFLQIEISNFFYFFKKKVHSSTGLANSQNMTTGSRWTYHKSLLTQMWACEPLLPRTRDPWRLGVDWTDIKSEHRDRAGCQSPWKILLPTSLTVEMFHICAPVTFYMSPRISYALAAGKNHTVTPLVLAL